jgi:hypothetical protein
MTFLTRLFSSSSSSSSAPSSSEEVLELANSLSLSSKFSGAFADLATLAKKISARQTYLSELGVAAGEIAILANGRIIKLSASDTFSAGDFMVLQTMEMPRAAPIITKLDSIRLEVDAEQQTRSDKRKDAAVN